MINQLYGIKNQRGVSRAAISLAWLYRNPVAAAPVVGALKTSHIDEAIKALEIILTNEEVNQLESSYTPRIDVNVKNSDPKAIAQMAATVGIKIALPTDLK